MDSGPLFQRPKRGLYVAYDHVLDGAAYASFVRNFSSLFRLERDNSLERELGAEDPVGHIRFLAEGPMAECDCVVVLCGAATYLSKFVDWEIKAGLDRRLGLIAVLLPSNPPGPAGNPLLPERLGRNFEGGFAVQCRSDDLAAGKADLGSLVAFARSRPLEMIDNSLPPRAV
jgi:hypothetical protein